MMSDEEKTAPIVEDSPVGGAEPDLTLRALNQRIRQQEILAELGVIALQETPFLELLDHTARLTAEGLEAEFCKVMEFRPSENRLFVRAGVGWHEGIVGKASVGADSESPAGFALRSGKPVISNHLENEERFRTPDLLAEHGIRRAMNVILQGDGSPFGVLEVDSRSEGEFNEKDISFLQGAANILGMAIERQRHQTALNAAVERQQLLLNEINHRVKNSLGVVSSMLNLQANSSDNPDLKGQLKEASRRVSTIGRAYERLAYDDDFEKIDIGTYLGQILDDLASAVVPCKIIYSGEKGLLIAADRATQVALTVNELVTNTAKYAYPGKAEGFIWIAVEREDGGRTCITVRDAGVGLPKNFDPMASKGLGMRLVGALTSQLKAELSWLDANPGTLVKLTISGDSSQD